jgi:hypothetical protein
VLFFPRTDRVTAFSRQPHIGDAASIITKVAVLLLIVGCALPSQAQTSWQRAQPATYRDAQNRYIGRTQTRSDGKLEARDAQGRFLGYFDPTSNSTFDAAAHFVGRGDQLPALIVAAQPDPPTRGPFERGPDGSPAHPDNILGLPNTTPQYAPALPDPACKDKPEQKPPSPKYAELYRRNARYRDPCLNPFPQFPQYIWPSAEDRANALTKYGPDGMTPNRNYGYTRENPMPEPYFSPPPDNYPVFNKTHIPDMGDPRGKAQQQYITATDRELADRALQIAAASPEPVIQPWIDSDTGNHGSYAVRWGVVATLNGQPCRSLSMQMTVHNQPITERFRKDVTDRQDQTACWFPERHRWGIVEAQHAW